MTPIRHSRSSVAPKSLNPDPLVLERVRSLSLRLGLSDYHPAVGHGLPPTPEQVLQAGLDAEREFEEQARDLARQQAQIVIREEALKAARAEAIRLASEHATSLVREETARLVREQMGPEGFKPTTDELEVFRAKMAQLPHQAAPLETTKDVVSKLAIPGRERGPSKPPTLPPYTPEDSADYPPLPCVLFRGACAHRC